MTAIQNIIDVLHDIDTRKDQIILDLVRDREAAVIKMNVDQMYNGIDANGNGIAPLYSESTIRYKKRQGQPYDRVTARDKGDFHNSLFLTYRNDEFSFDSDDKKKIWLMKKYGPSILGINESNLNALREMLREPLFEELKKIISNA